MVKIQHYNNLSNLCVNEYHEEKSCKKGVYCGFRHIFSQEERTDPSIQEAMKGKWLKINNMNSKVQFKEKGNRGTSKCTYSLMEEMMTLMQGMKNVIEKVSTNNP